MLLAAILSSLVYAMLIEYAIHRWFMHRPFPWRSQWYVEHAIEHHGHGRLDVNIELPPWTVAPIAAPLLAWCCVLGAAWALCVSAMVIAYSIAWTVLHTAHHDLGWKWLNRVPLYARWRSHHLKHHAAPHTNFGTVFPWVDYLFGTKS